MTHYVYAGVPQWSSTDDSELLGGLFRQEMGENRGATWNEFPLPAGVRNAYALACG